MVAQRDYYLHPTDADKYGEDVDIYYPDQQIRPHTFALGDWMRLYASVCKYGWSDIQREEWMRLLAEAERWDGYGDMRPFYGFIHLCDTNGVPVEGPVGQGAEGGSAGVGTPPRAASDIA